MIHYVIPAQAGIHDSSGVVDPRLHGGDNKGVFMETVATIQS